MYTRNENIERVADALDRIATALEKKQATDLIGMEIAENFSNMIGEIIKASEPDQVDPETQHLADIAEDKTIPCPTCHTWINECFAGDHCPTCGHPVPGVE